MYFFVVNFKMKYIANRYAMPLPEDEDCKMTLQCVLRALSYTISSPLYAVTLR